MLMNYGEVKLCGRSCARVSGTHRSCRTDAYNEGVKASSDVYHLRSKPTVSDAQVAAYLVARLMFRDRIITDRLSTWVNHFLNWWEAGQNGENSPDCFSTN